MGSAGNYVCAAMAPRQAGWLRHVGWEERRNHSGITWYYHALPQRAGFTFQRMMGHYQRRKPEVDFYQLKDELCIRVGDDGEILYALIPGERKSHNDLPYRDHAEVVEERRLLSSDHAAYVLDVPHH